MTGAALGQSCDPSRRPVVVLQADASFAPQDGGAAQALDFGAVLGGGAGGMACLANVPGRVLPPEAVAPALGTVLRLRDEAVGAPRPRIGFFADRTGLVAFLSRTSPDALTPLLEEAGPGTSGWQVPVMASETIETALGSIVIVEVAVPLSQDALTLWGQIATAQTAPLPLIVLDRRRHAQRFSEVAYQALIGGLSASGGLAAGVDLVEIGAGSQWSAPRAVAFADLDPMAADPDPALPRPRLPPGPYPAFDQPTVLLLAGDYDLSAVPGLAGNPQALALQATPELDWTLRDSAGALNLTFRDYATQPEAVLRAVMDLPGLGTGGRAAEERLQAEAAAAQARFGFPEIAPTGSLTLPDAAPWIALRLWVVVTPDVLEVVAP